MLIINKLGAESPEMMKEVYINKGLAVVICSSRLKWGSYNSGFSKVLALFFLRFMRYMRRRLSDESFYPI